MARVPRSFDDLIAMMQGACIGTVIIIALTRSWDMWLLVVIVWAVTAALMVARRIK